MVNMDRTKTIAIDIVEASYDLEVGAAEWLPQLFDAGKGMFDLGLGATAALVSGVSPEGLPMMSQMVPGTVGPGFFPALMRAAQETGPDMIRQTSEAWAGVVTALSDDRERWPTVFEAITTNVGCKDIFGLFAMDPDRQGVQITMPSPDLIQMSSKAREQWQMLAIHMAAGHRLRRKLMGPSDVSGVPFTEMPLNAEALLDPSRFLVTQAAGGAKDGEASKTIREAAVRIDKARGKLRKSDPAEALEIWHGLVRGRWSLVDWFDTDGRRFVLAKPNAPQIGDPRGLTEREHQVATYAALGETSKIIGYRFGVSPPRVSALLNAAMRKLGVKTQAQLVEKMRGLPGQPTEEAEN
jgi:DNA-binding CsgD family transcriptional regulator